MINDQLIVYKNISQDDVVLKCLSFMDGDASIDESEFIASLLVLAEKYELHGQLLYMTGGESHSVRYMRATTKPLVRATSSDKRASPYRLAS